MLDGDAPIGNDGKAAQLHHVLQKESRPMAGVRETTLTEYHRILHGLVGAAAVSGTILDSRSNTRTSAVIIGNGGHSNDWKVANSE